MQLDIIKDQFKKVISFSQGIGNPKVDKLFDRWLEAKRDFIEAMNGELIYEYPKTISFTLGEQEKYNRITNFVSLIEQRYNNYKLAKFIYDMRDGFFDNVVLENYQVDDKRIRKGMKLVKAFKFFEKDKNALTDIQNCASRIIQEDKIEGKLCLSVHPLDFLSLSENTHNWRSCHALDGEYRSGNLSYMMDKSTIICYLKSEKEELLPNFSFKWNSKKWRVLLFFSSDWNMIMAGRQYPFSTEVGLNFILSDLLKSGGLSTNNCWTPWHNELLTNLPFSNKEEGAFFFENTYVPVGKELVKLSELVKDMPGSMQFNDLLRSHYYTPQYAFRVFGKSFNRFLDDECGESNSEKTRFFIGGNVPCLHCEENDLEITESMLCISCEKEVGTMPEDEDFEYCDCCGSRIHLEDVNYINHGEYIVCERCFYSEASECEQCGDRVYNSDLIFDRKLEKYICQECKDALEERSWRIV